ncbi:MAG: class I SAM-dependent methyltransferase [Candidatus Andersenbacteria bacterium]|nr:class I SAM-dependent methyltransferase [bacterium]MDZ4225403.1 class I SAM-dependent methyltransferase [Candidatus Andersenbacteria bacterium]
MYRLEKYYPAGFDRGVLREDRFAQEHIAGNSSDQFAKQDFWPLLEKNLEKGKHYLDIGCGIGGWIIYLTEQGYEVEGVDIAARTIRALTEYNPDLKVKVASMTALPYPDASLDGALAVGTLEYMEDKAEAAVQEVGRVLKTGGLFFLEVPAINVLRRIFYLPLKSLERVVRRVAGQRPSFANYLFSRREITALLEKNGFIVEEAMAHDLPDKDSHFGLYINFPFLRGHEPYKLNWLGVIVKQISNAISPWVASTGMAVVAKKK